MSPYDAYAPPLLALFLASACSSTNANPTIPPPEADAAGAPSSEAPSTSPSPTSGAPNTPREDGGALADGGVGGDGNGSTPPPTPAPTYDLVPLWEVLETETWKLDALYTMDYSETDYVLGQGYTTRSVAGFIPCSVSGLSGPNGETGRGHRADFGYDGIPMAFGCAPPAGTAPLYRLYKDYPTTDHFYTTSKSEFDGAVAHGYAFEKVEGYLFTSQVTGSLPLYRLSRCPGLAPLSSVCDVEHRYTLSSDTKDTLLASNSGWALDGIAGYAFDGYVNATAKVTFDGTVNGIALSSANPTVVPIRDVVPPKGTITLKGQGRAAGSGYMMSNSTPRPAGATQQRMIFTLNTGNLFDATSAVDHIPIALRFHAQLGSDGIIGRPYDGIGIFLARPNWYNDKCGTATYGGQVFIEGYQNAKFVMCSNLDSALKLNHSYEVELTATDSGLLGYKFTDLAPSTPNDPYRVQSKTVNVGYGTTPTTYSCPFAPAPGSLSVDKLYCNNPWSLDHYPATRTGYAILPLAYSSDPNTTEGSLSGLTIQWLDPSGNVLSSQ